MHMTSNVTVTFEIQGDAYGERTTQVEHAAKQLKPSSTVVADCFGCEHPFHLAINGKVRLSARPPPRRRRPRPLVLILRATTVKWLRKRNGTSRSSSKRKRKQSDRARTVSSRKIVACIMEGRFTSYQPLLLS